MGLRVMESAREGWELNLETRAAAAGMAGLGIGEAETRMDQVIGEVDLEPVEIHRADLIGNHAQAVVIVHQFIRLTEGRVDGGGIAHAGAAARHDRDAHELRASDTHVLQLVYCFVANGNTHTESPGSSPARISAGRQKSLPRGGSLYKPRSDMSAIHPLRR